MKSEAKTCKDSIHKHKLKTKMESKQAKICVQSRASPVSAPSPSGLVSSCLSSLIASSFLL